MRSDPDETSEDATEDDPVVLESEFLISIDLSDEDDPDVDVVRLDK